MILGLFYKKYDPPFIELDRMIYQSERSKIKYFDDNKSRMETDYLDEYELAQEYAIAEKNNLMMESGALIEFIKFVKCDPQNATKMGDIAAIILQVKDQI